MTVPVIVLVLIFLLQDNKINGVTHNTRLLGSSYLFPYVIPDPHVSITEIRPEDQLIIIGNHGLWKSMSYQEAVDEVINIPDPVLAAKKLQDLAQGYRSVENIGVLVVRLLSSAEEKMRMRILLQKHYEDEQTLLADLKLRDIEREEMKKKTELEEIDDAVPMDIVKLKSAKKRRMINAVFNEKNDVHTDELDRIEIKPFPKHIIDNKDPTANWETVLQKRLTEEVKNKELIAAMQIEQADQRKPSGNENWLATAKLRERIVTLPPAHKKQISSSPPLPPPPPHFPRRQIIPEAAQLSTESLEFQRELKHPLNVDRDAVLFHQMQLIHSKSHHISSNSINSTQSDPARMSLKEVSVGTKSSSHSIEVLIHGPTNLSFTTQKYNVGSHKLPTECSEPKRRHSLDDSCPTDILITKRSNQSEENFFLLKDTRLAINDIQDLVETIHTPSIGNQETDVSLQENDEKLDIRKLHNKNVEEEEFLDSEIQSVNEDNIISIYSTDSSYFAQTDVCIESPFEDSDSGSSSKDVKCAEEGTSAMRNRSQKCGLLKQKDRKYIFNSDKVSKLGEIMIKGSDRTDDMNGLQAAVKKAEETVDKNFHSAHLSASSVSEKENGIPTPEDLYLQKKDSFESGKTVLKSSGLNSGCSSPQKLKTNAKSLKIDDLLTHKMMHPQTSYKHNLKLAPPPPVSPLKGQPLQSMATRTSSQRSIITTYL